jgi:hypothetical protein
MNTGYDDDHFPESRYAFSMTSTVLVIFQNSKAANSYKRYVFELWEKAKTAKASPEHKPHCIQRAHEELN